MKFVLVAAGCLSLLVCRVAEARAQHPVGAPPPPVPPATISRDGNGQATVRAIRLTAPLVLDGRLDEDIYSHVPPAGNFIQQLPREGEAATEATDVWVFFDDRNFYVSARCHDSHADREIVTEVRRDGTTMSQNDNFTFVLDTFLDRRTGYYFQTNPLGAVREQALVNGVTNESWNTVWDVRAARDAGGYTVEMVVPFKSLRYRGAGPQTWGINFRRIVKWKNETSTLTRLPAEYTPGGIIQLAVAGTLVGVEAPAQSMNLELKPWALSSSTTDRLARAPFSNDLAADAGIDVKYGLTRGLTADVTINTDFAQVEEDLQQVNLTRFNLQFPEKRDFFLEGQGIFVFGGQGGDVPTLFFSRQIGLSRGLAVPVWAGARVTGKAGPYDIGMLNVQTGDSAEAGAVATNFSTVRIRRDVLRRSSVGVLATTRVPAGQGRGSNAVVGMDADLTFYRNIESQLYWARTSTPGLQGEDTSYRGRVAYTGDRYGATLDHVMVGGRFNPEVGFVRRDDYRRTYLDGRFSPRLQKHRTIRKLTWQASVDHVTDARARELQDRETGGSFGVEFHNSDIATLRHVEIFEQLPEPFSIAPRVVVPAGGYDTRTTTASYQLGQQRLVSGTVSVSHGSFYRGTRSTASYSGRLAFSPRFVVEPGVSWNWVELPYGSFSARLASARVIVTPTPRLMLSGLVQVNPTTRTLTASTRLRWEYVPGSELFVVYSDGRDTAGPGYPDLLNRTIAVKATRLLRF